jgi:hypothetical protein
VHRSQSTVREWPFPAPIPVRFQLIFHIIK